MKPQNSQKLKFTSEALQANQKKEFMSESEDGSPMSNTDDGPENESSEMRPSESQEEPSKVHDFAG